MRDSVRAAVLRASGLEPAQYAILRERLSAWLAVQNGKPAGSYVFAAAEVEALEAREVVVITPIAPLDCLPAHDQVDECGVRVSVASLRPGEVARITVVPA